MSDNVTNTLLLEHLKSIQAKLVTMDGQMGNIENDVRSLKQHMVGFMQSEVAQDNAIATLQSQLERRLELND